MIKKIIVFLFAFASLVANAQEQPQMADGMRAEGKIYVVIAVMATIFVCIASYVFILDRKLKKLEDELPNYKYLPTFSREPENDLVRRGYVHSVYEEIIGTDKPDAKFYLCGWKNMIDDAKQKILALGYDRKAIHLELYG